MFRNALVDWGPKTISELVGGTVPFIGDKENQVLAEITAEGVAGLNPDNTVHANVAARALVRILGEDILNVVYDGSTQPTDHFVIETGLQINGETLATDWLEIGFKLVDLQLFNWESPEITLFAYGVPNVASINAYLQFFVNAVLNAGVTIAIDPALLSNPLQLPEILGLTTPTFVAPTITPGISIGGEIEILGFDLASIAGSISFGFTPALGLPSTAEDELVPFEDFFNPNAPHHACLGATGTLSGEIAAEVLGFEVFSFDLPSANFNFNPSCTVLQHSLSLAPEDFEGTTTFHSGDALVDQIVIDPVPNIAIDPSSGEGIYLQLIDADPSANTRNNLAFARRQNDVWSGLSDVAGGPELGKHISNPVLAATNDNAGAPAVVVYQAIDEAGAVEDLTRNDFLSGQDIRWRYFDGTAWGTEQSLTSDSLYDTEHTVSFNSTGQGVTAWVHNTNPTPLSDANSNTPGAMDRAANEIQIAVWNSVTHTWEAVETLTTNSVSDSKPTVFAGEDGTLYTLWLQDTATGNQIMYSTHTGSGWSTPAVLENNGIIGGKYGSVAIGSEGSGRVDVLFSHVVENPDLSAQSRLYNRPTTIAGFASPAAVEIVSENANYAHLRTLQHPADGSLVAYWQQSDGVTLDVFASHLDPNSSTWTRPFRLTNGDVEVTPSLAIDTDGTYQLVYEENSFISAPSSAPNASLAAELSFAPPVGVPAVGNVASSSTAMLPELSFSRMLNFPLNSKASVGTLETADGQIINRGPVGDSVLIEYITGDINSPTTIESETIFLGPGGRFNIHHDFVVQPGQADYSVRLTAQGGAEVVGDMDNVSTTSLLGEVDIKVESVALSNPTPQEGETVKVTAQISNLSNQAIATPFTVEYFQGDPDLTFAPASVVPLGSKTINSIGAMGTETIKFEWTVPTGGGNFAITVFADSNDVIDEATEFNNKGLAVVVVRPDAAAVVGSVVATELGYSGSDNVEVTATIINHGDATLNNLRVQLLSSYDDLLTPVDDAAVTFAHESTFVIPSLAAGASTDVLLIGDGLAGLNSYRVVVDPAMQQIDSNWSNNVAGTSLILQGLPDLQVEILGLDPDDGMSLPMPIQGDLLTVRTRLSNTGILPARDFKVEVFARNPSVGNILVGTKLIDEMAPLSSIGVDIPIDTSRLLGFTSLVVVVDRLDKVLEIDEGPVERLASGIFFESKAAVLNCGILAACIKG